MRKSLNLVSAVIVYALLTVGCQKDNPNKINEPQEVESLVGTNWQLIAYVDVENDISRPPKGWEDNPPNLYSYLLSFGTDNQISGRAGNVLIGNYSIDYNTNKLSIFIKIVTEAIGLPEQNLYEESLNQVQSFIVKKGTSDTLLLFYNNDRNCLKFLEWKE